MMEIKKATQILLAALIFIGGVHILLLEYVLPANYYDFSLIYIYIFFLAFWSIATYGILMVKKHHPDMLLNALLVVIMLNFMASLAFLLPDLLDKDEYTEPYVYQFFGIFFPILALETLVLARIVGQKEKKSI